jgi:hypothetical protein
MNRDPKNDYEHLNRTDLRPFDKKDVWRKVRRSSLVREFERAVKQKETTPLLDLFEY